MEEKRNLGLITSFLFFLFATVIVIIIGFSYGFSIGDMLAKWGNGCLYVLEFIMLSILLWMSVASIVEAPPVGRITRGLSGLVSSHASAGLLITFVAVVLGWVNWILGMYFSLLLAREIARVNLEKGIELHYPYLLSCAFSASAVGLIGLFSPVQLYLADKVTHIGSTAAIVPIPISETVFSPASLTISILLIILLPVISYLIRPKGSGTIALIPDEELKKPRPDDIIYHRPKPKVEQVLAEKLENSYIITLVASVVGLVGISYHLLFLQDPLTFRRAIFLLFMLGLLLNKRPIEYAYKMRETAKLSAYVPIGVFFGAGLSTLTIYIGLCEQLSNGISALGVLIPVFGFICSFIVALVIPEPSTIWVLFGPLMVEASLKAPQPYILSVVALMCGVQLSRFLQPYIHLPVLGFSDGTHLREMAKYLRINMAVIFIICIVVICGGSYFGFAG